MSKNNLIQIGGELVNTVGDGIIADAAAVKDYTEGKTQATINAEMRDAIDTIEKVIPSTASEQNKLTDKSYVDNSISTNTANFVGTFETLAELQAVQNPTNNDYGFVIEQDALDNEYYDRYKYNASTQQWLFEYKVESTPFTAEQWAAIQSGMTAALVTKLEALPTAQQLSTQLAGKQATIPDLATIRSGAAAGATAAVNTGDKAYDAADFSGLGRVNLRKNIVTSGGTDKNVLTQAMMNTANTIYHIQYDYDLNGQTITLPAGCMLEFDGGSVKNGIITGNGTFVKDTDAEIFGDDVVIAGTWKNSAIRSSWFETNDDTLNNILAMNDDRATDIYITEDLTAFPADFNGLDVASNTRVFLSATIIKSTSVDETYSVFGVNNAENVSIFGGLILGTRESAHATEYGMGIHISNSKNVRVSTSIKNTTGDGIYITSASSGVIIENCVFEGNGRNGISVIEAENVDVKNSTFKNIKYKAPMAGIDVEPNTSEQIVKNFSASNCIFENCQNSIESAGTRGVIENVEMLNCSVYADETIITLFLSNYTKNIRIADCSFVGNSSTTYSIAASFSDKVTFENCKIVTDKMFNLTSSKVLFLNNIIEGTSYLFDALSNSLFMGNTITTPKGSGARGIVNVSFIKNILNIGGISNSSGSAKNIFFENNKIVFNAEYQCVNLKDGKLVRFINNDIEMTGNRSLVVFNNVNDIIFSHNTIDVKSNQKLFDVTNSKDVSVMDNLITLPQTYSFQVYNGVNLLTTKSNRKGDRLFFESIGKYAVFNGEKWVDDNNFTAALGKGATTSRPTSIDLYTSDAGFQFYDETLTKPTFLKVTQGNAAITRTNIAKNIVDDVYYGVNTANTLTQGENYIYKTSYHTARTFKAAFRKTNNTAYEDADELLIAETKSADNLPIKAPDPAVYPYIFFCNLAYDTQVVTAWLYNVTMEWVDATGTAV